MYTESSVKVIIQTEPNFPTLETDTSTLQRQRHFIRFKWVRYSFTFEYYQQKVVGEQPKYTEFRYQRNFFFLSIFKTGNNLKNVLLIIIYIACLSYCIIKSGFHVRMRGYSHSSTKVLFPYCTCTC